MIRITGMRWEWIYQLGIGTLIFLGVFGSMFTAARGGTVEGAGIGVVMVVVLAGIMGLIRLHSSRQVLEASPRYVQLRSIFRTQQVALDRLKAAKLAPDQPAAPGGSGMAPTWATLQLEDHDGGRISLEMPFQVGPKSMQAEKAQIWRWVEDAIYASGIQVSHGLAASLATFSQRDQADANVPPVAPADISKTGQSQAVGMGGASIVLALGGFVINYLGFMATLIGVFGLITGVRQKAPWWALALNGVGIIAGLWVRVVTGT